MITNMPAPRSPRKLLTGPPCGGLLSGINDSSTGEKSQHNRNSDQPKGQNHQISTKRLVIALVVFACVELAPELSHGLLLRIARRAQFDDFTQEFELIQARR